MFNVPAIVLAMLVLIGGVHFARFVLSESAEQALTLTLAFIPDRYSLHPLAWPGGELSSWASPLTYMAVHGDATHLLFNAASLLAFGGVVARRLGSVGFALFTVACGVAGAALFLALNPGLQAPLIGASGAISGMMAAALRLLFSALDGAPAGLAGEMIRRAPNLIALKRLWPALADRRLQLATGSWLFINLLAAFGWGTPANTGVIAWEAHVGGYLAGLFIFGLFDSGVRREARVARSNGDEGAGGSA